MRLRVRETHLKFYPEGIRKKARPVELLDTRLHFQEATFECDIEWWELPSPDYCLYRTHSEHRVGKLKLTQNYIGAAKDWDAHYLVLAEDSFIERIENSSPIVPSVKVNADTPQGG